MTLTLDPAAQTRARGLGAEGLAWLDALPGLVEDLARDWRLQLGPSLLGGTASADPSAEMRGWCRMLTDETGVDAQAIWEWGSIERVSSGPHIMGLGRPDWGRPFLDVAARLR